MGERDRDGGVSPDPWKNLHQGKMRDLRPGRAFGDEAADVEREYGGANAADGLASKLIKASRKRARDRFAPVLRRITGRGSKPQ